MKKKKLPLWGLLLLLLPLPILAQAPIDDTTQLIQWVKAQQKYGGTGLDLHGVKSVVTWWDVISYGQSGLNVGKAGALDWADIGPGMAVTNKETPRYGQMFPLHLGNIWNSVADRLPPKIASHVYIARLPSNLIVSGLFLVPDRRPIKQWRWTSDFKIVIGYRFGGL